MCVTVHVGTLEQLQVIQDENDNDAMTEDEEGTCTVMTGEKIGKMQKTKAKTKRAEGKATLKRNQLPSKVL